jgi:hypothetical protein
MKPYQAGNVLAFHSVKAVDLMTSDLLAIRRGKRADQALPSTSSAYLKRSLVPEGSLPTKK